MAFFKKLFAKPEQAAREFQVVPIAEIHALLEPQISAVLEPLGFEVRGPLAWIRSVDAPIRQMFEINQWKGGVVVPSWGVSLDFVPHVSGSSVKWHRVPKSAKLDLRVDPASKESDMSYHWGPSQLLRDAPAALEVAFPLAKEWWASITCVDDLPSAFERLKEYYAQRGGLGFYNFTQHPIAYAFSLAKVGRVAEANNEFDEHLSRGWPPAVQERMRELLSLAAADARQ